MIQDFFVFHSNCFGFFLNFVKDIFGDKKDMHGSIRVDKLLSNVK